MLEIKKDQFITLDAHVRMPQDEEYEKFQKRNEELQKPVEPVDNSKDAKKPQRKIENG